MLSVIDLSISSSCSLQVKEQKAELAQANEAAADGDAKLTRMAADHKRLVAKADAVQQEVRLIPLYLGTCMLFWCGSCFSAAAHSRILLTCR